MGWERTVRYFRHRFFREGDSTYRVTAGLASGGAISFSPFFGTHLFQAAGLALLIRASWPAALVGTLVGNPWTFPFMLKISYDTGTAICSLFGADAFVTLPENFSLEYVLENPGAFFSYLFAHPMKLLLPQTIGGYTVGLIYWIVSYLVMFYPVDLARKAYRKERLRRAMKRAQKREAKKDKDANTKKGTTRTEAA